jgi:hypothetical protein
MAQSFTDGRTDVEIYTRCRASSVSSSGEQRGAYGSWVVSSTDIVGRRGCDLQEQRTCGYESTPVGTGSVVGRIENVTSEIEK